MRGPIPGDARGAVSWALLGRPRSDHAASRPRTAPRPGPYPARRSTARRRRSRRDPPQPRPFPARLGGSNPDRSFRQLRARCRPTTRLSLAGALRVHDSYVRAHVTAHYADGSAQKCLLVFQVRDGVIAAERAVAIGGP